MGLAAKKKSSILTQWLPDAMKSVELYQSNTTSMAFYSNKNPFKERDNEDAAFFMIKDSIAILAIADGVGGSRGGKQAANLTLKLLERNIFDAFEQGLELRPQITKACESANESLLNQGIGAGTTVLIALITDQTLQTIHAGDSSCLVVGGRGKIKYRSIDHSVVGYGQEAELIEEREAQEHEHKHILLNCVGMPEMRLEIGPKIRLNPKDRILVGSDGLFDNFTDEELAEIIYKASLKQQAETLKMRCLERMNKSERVSSYKPDDLTFILI